MRRFAVGIVLFSGFFSGLGGCLETNLGAANTAITGASGPQGSAQKTEQLPTGDRPLGRVALVEKQIPALAQMGLTSPVPVIRLLMAQSNCFQAAAATGRAKTSDLSFALGGASFASGVAGLGGGYSNTAIGKTTVAAFLDAYRNLVLQLQKSPTLVKR